MRNDSRSTRRDERHLLRPGSSFVELPDASRSWVALTRISSSGLAFEVDPTTQFTPGTRLERIAVCVCACRVPGDAVVRSVSRKDEERTEVGCIFYPASHELAERWMALLAGLEAADPHPDRETSP